MFKIQQMKHPDGYLQRSFLMDPNGSRVLTFLSQPHLPIADTEDINVSQDDPEVKKCHTFVTNQQDQGNYDITQFDGSLSWRSLYKAVWMTCKNTD